METVAPRIVNRPAGPTPAAAVVSSPVAKSPSSAGFSSPSTQRYAASIEDMRARSTAERDDGQRVFRTRDGKDIELPEGMTVAEAAKLEADALAAEKKLGKGPAPKPVPDVKALAKKPPKKEPPKPAPAKKRAGAAAGKGAPSAGAAAAMLLKAVGKSKVALYLATRGAPVLSRGLAGLGALKRNEQTHATAGEKLGQAVKAVVHPPSEGQSKSNDEQVKLVDARPAPAADAAKARAKLTSTLEENVPRTIEDVDNFKRDQKAQHVGAAVLDVVQGDSTAVTSTFGDVKETPPPAPPEQVPEALPPQEAAPATATLALGRGAVAPLEKEHTDVSNFTKEADGKLKEEGVTQEQLDMVDSGDLAEANREKRGMESKAKTEPLAIQRSAVQEAQAVDQSLAQDEKKQRDAIKAKRKEALTHTAGRQQGAKTALEKKREEVASKINGIYTAAQTKVKKRLADLETESMKRFDDGNASASKAFEDNVNRELEAFKDDRYSGWFGWARRAKDWLLGMDDLPEVKAIFDRNRAAFVRSMDTLVASISADQKKVIQECKDELANARKQIKEYVESLGPALQDIGKQEAEKMNGKLSELDQLVAKKEEDLQAALKEKQQAAIRAIDQKIEKMKEAMSGALAKLGKLLLMAAKKFFAWALEKFGVSLATIQGIIDKGTAVLKAIFTGPIQFVKNLVRAAGQGFESFGKNFLTHLKNALFEWLTGSLQGLVLPETWDLKGILSVVFQMLGITYANFRSHLVKLVPEPVVKGLEIGFTLVKTLVTEGPMAAWEQLKEIASEMKDAFIEAIKDWIKWKVVQKAIETVLAMFIPGAGILRAILGIYDTVVFFIQKAKDILKMVGSFLDSVADIAAGNIAGAAAALEAGLARGLVLVIDFLARFLRLSGITAKIREAIAKVRGKVDGVMEKVATWIVAQAKKLGKLAVSGAKSAVRAVAGWLGLRQPFQTKDGESHTLYFEKKGEEPQLIRASDLPTEIGDFLVQLDADDAFKKDPKKSQLARAKKVAGELKLLTRTGATKADNTTTSEEKRVVEKVSELSRLLVNLLPGDTPDVPAVDWSQRARTKTSQHSRVYYLSSATAKGGSAASGETDEYKFAAKGGWLRMHLIPYSIGGFGTPENWVPAPVSINSGGPVKSFETAMEKAVRSAAITGAGMRARKARAARPNVIWCESEVDTPLTPAPVDGSGKVLTFFTRFVLKCGIYRPEGDTWVKVAAPLSQQTFTNNVPPDDGRIYLGSSSGTAMRGSGILHLSSKSGHRKGWPKPVPDYPDRLVELIKQERGAGFGTYAVLLSRLKKATANARLFNEQMIDDIVADFQARSASKKDIAL